MAAVRLDRVELDGGQALLTAITGHQEASQRPPDPEAANQGHVETIAGVGTFAEAWSLHEWHRGCKLEMSFVPPRDRGTMWSMAMADGRPRAGGMPVANTADPPPRRLETLRQLQDLLRGDGGSRYVEEDSLFDPNHPTYAVALDEESTSVSHGHHLESTWIVRSGLHLRERPVGRGTRCGGWCAPPSAPRRGRRRSHPASAGSAPARTCARPPAAGRGRPPPGACAARRPGPSSFRPPSSSSRVPCSGLAEDEAVVVCFKHSQPVRTPRPRTPSLSR